MCKEILEEMRLLISKNVSGRQSNQFPNVSIEYMKGKNSTFLMQDVGHMLIMLKKTNIGYKLKKL